VTFLSTRRRHPLAGLLVVLLGLVLTGGIYAAFAPAQASQSAKADDELIEQGRQLFVVGCASCHGLNAEGVVLKDGNNYGPSLVGVGPAAVSFQVGTGRMPLQQPGVQAPTKTVLYSPEEIAALSAYVGSLAPGPDIPSESETDPTLGDIVNGGELFRTNCTACHNFGAVGGELPSGGRAPSLLDTSNEHIIEAMLTGPGQMPVFSDEVMTPDEKRDILAYIDQLKQQDSYGGSDLGSKGPVAEGLWGWLVGIGALVLVAVWIGNNSVRAGKKQR
jgi:ubiquinol-cytochrome c reductase cytochrome c subunit